VNGKDRRAAAAVFPLLAAGAVLLNLLVGCASGRVDGPGMIYFYKEG
jgi:hypothetical protein